MIVSEVLVKRDPVQDTQRIPSEFVVIEDGIPSFGQAVDDDEKVLADAMIQPRVDSYWASIKETERYPDKTVRIAKVMPTGEIKLFQVWQVAFPGKRPYPQRRLTICMTKVCKPYRCAGRRGGVKFLRRLLTPLLWGMLLN